MVPPPIPRVSEFPSHRCRKRIPETQAVRSASGNAASSGSWKLPQPGFPDRPNLHQHDLEERHLSPMVNIPVVG